MPIEVIFKKKSVFRVIKSYLIITLGLAIYSFSWIAIIAPAKLVGGGVSGISMIIYYATGSENGGIPIGYTFLAFNAVLLGIATFFIGSKFSVKTIYGIIAVSIFMSLMQKFLPEDILKLSSDKLLSTILGGGISAVGISMVFSQGGTSGGIDIIAMVINKYRNISYGRIFIVCDAIIIGSSYFVFHEISTVIYGFVLIGIYGYAIDAIIAGNKQSSQIMIISKDYQKIANRIENEIHRGVTVLEGNGWYSKKPQKVLMVVCRKSETTSIYKIIKECDPKSFITVGSVMGVFGEGFENLQVK